MNSEKQNQYEKKHAETYRHRLIKVFNTHVPSDLIPIQYIQIITEVIMYLSLLQFVVDYFSQTWFGTFTPILLYLDISYYFSLLNPNNFEIVSFIFISLISLYWIMNLVIFIFGIHCNNTICNIRKLAFIITKNILCLPSLHFTIEFLVCNNKLFNSYCFNTNLALLIFGIVSEIMFLVTILSQTYLDIQFIDKGKDSKRIRHTGITSVSILSFGIINQTIFYLIDDVVQLITISLTSTLILAIIIYRDDQLNQTIKLIQVSSFSIILSFSLYIWLLKITQGLVPGYPIVFIALFILLAIMQSKTMNLKFQLENINKWATPNIMMSYAKKLRYYLSRKSEYMYKIFIHGYMEIHRQKCDHPTCPSRSKLTQFEKSLFPSDRQFRELEQCLRTENLIKKIYDDGYKLNPISSSLQLENSIFLYERNQKQQALKHLLMINFRHLSLGEFYKYDFLVKKIHAEIMEKPNKFLDLIDEIQEKNLQKIMMKKLEQSALIVLEYWSILNEDHPDFTKLNEIGLEVIKIRQELKEIYRNICLLVYNEKLTLLYTIYLQNIENDEKQFDYIYQQIMKDYHLKNMIVMQDWSNSSSNILIVSIESNYGEIIHVNSSCANLFGYQKFQLVNQSLSVLFLQEDKYLQAFLKDNGEEIFYIMHKSGFAMRIKKNMQNYNSMQTGMAMICNLTVLTEAYQCSFLFDKSHKVIAVTSSILSVLGIDPRFLQGQEKNMNYFIFQNKKVKSFIQQNSKQLKIKSFLRQSYLDPQKDNSSLYRLKYEDDSPLYNVLHVQEIRNRKEGMIICKPSQERCTFSFQTQIKDGMFTYIGVSEQSQSFLSQFSKILLMKEDEQEQKVINYAQGISTYRLFENIIQVIQDNPSQIIFEKMNYNQEQSQNLLLTRQDEQEVFTDKKSFIKFIQSYTIGTYIYFVFIIATAIIVSMNVSYFFIYRYQNQVIAEQTIRIIEISEVVGIVAKQQNFVNRLELAHLGLGEQNATIYVNHYQENLRKLFEMQTKGFDGYPLTLPFDEGSIVILTRQFMLTVFNYANIFMSKVKRPPLNLKYLYSEFSTLDTNQQNYLDKISFQAVNQIKAYSHDIQLIIKQQMAKFDVKGIVMVALAVVLIFILLLLIIYFIHSLNIEKIKIFQTFLEIPEAKIEELSNRAQKLLISMHTQENNDVGIQEQLQNNKKNNSTFAKKKSFKQITFNKLIYIKLSIIILLFFGFFVHSYYINTEILQFQNKSIDYFSIVALSGYQFYQELTQIQQEMMAAYKNNTISLITIDTTAYVVRLKTYYNQLFETHYKTFGFVPSYHDAFKKIMYGDICRKQSTAYGDFSIEEACLFGIIGEKGIYYIFQSLIVQMATRNGSSPIQPTVYVHYETISSASNILISYLKKCQENILSNHLDDLVIMLLSWIFTILGVLIIWIIPNLRIFVNQINTTKNIISILPISYAKNSGKVKKYISKIMKSNR